MAVTNPRVTFSVKLPRRKYARCVVWDNIPDLRANTNEAGPEKDYRALFIPIFGGTCIGTLHLSMTDLKNGTRAHEISHALDHYMQELFGELRAQITEQLTDDVDAVLRREGLL